MLGLGSALRSDQIPRTSIMAVALAQSSALVIRLQPNHVKQLPTKSGAAAGVTPMSRERLRRLTVRRPSTWASAAFVTFLCLGWPITEAAAQKRGDRVRVLAGSALRTAPGGQVVGVLSRVYESPVEMVQGSAVRLTLNGFVRDQDVRLEANGARALMGPANGRSDIGGTLRTARGEKEPVLATLQRGAVVFPGARSASFFAVSRTIWVDKSRLAKFTGPGAERPATRPTAAGAANPNVALQRPRAPAPITGPPAGQPPQAAVPGQPAAQAGAQSSAASASPPMRMTAAAPLRTGPNGNSLLSLPAGTVVTPLSTENGWTRVRVDGWVATAELADLDAKGSAGLSAADLRADPEGMKGRVVRWTVENLSYQLGDGLRRELNGEPYLLARGPGNERAILYLAVPDSLVERARALAPLSTINITARVRSGKSQPGGVPILDLVELLKR